MGKYLCNHCYLTMLWREVGGGESTRERSAEGCESVQGLRRPVCSKDIQRKLQNWALADLKEVCTHLKV